MATTASLPGEFYCPSCERHFPIGDRCPNDGTKLVRLAKRLDPLLGRDLDGRYTILQMLGKGAMGAVYRGSQHSVERDVAIKVINASLITDVDVIRRFSREAKLASRLNHPNAVSVLEFGQTDDGLLYLVMELVSGRTLDHILEVEKVLAPEKVVGIGVQVCDALEVAHALSIVHRDLKPANIMLLDSPRDMVKVLDFGLAKSVTHDSMTKTMTAAGVILGTPAFMPPELATGRPADGRADLYSLGCVLYLMGSGRLPFDVESAHELVALHGYQPAPPMPVVPRALGAVIDRLLLKNPDARYQTAAETRAALEDALANPDASSPFDTAVSLGPFPIDDPRPLVVGKRNLASNDRDLARAPTSAASTPTFAPPRRSRLPLIITAVIALAAVATVMLLLMRPTTQRAALPPVVDARTTIDAAVAPAIDAALAAATTDAALVVASPADAAAPPAAIIVRPRPHITPHVVKPPEVVTPPTPPPPTPPPPPPNKLPF